MVTTQTIWPYTSARVMLERNLLIFGLVSQSKLYDKPKLGLAVPNYSVTLGCTTWTEDLKCREVKTAFCRKRSMKTSSSETLIGWKSGKTTYVPLWDRMEGGWLLTLETIIPTFESSAPYLSITNATKQTLPWRPHLHLYTSENGVKGRKG